MRLYLQFSSKLTKILFFIVKYLLVTLSIVNYRYLPPLVFRFFWLSICITSQLGVLFRGVRLEGAVAQPLIGLGRRRPPPYEALTRVFTSFLANGGPYPPRAPPGWRKIGEKGWWMLGFWDEGFDLGGEGALGAGFGGCWLHGVTGGGRLVGMKEVNDA